MRMPRFLKMEIKTKEGMINMFNDKSLMLKMADVLRQENLISFEEQERVKRLIRESEDI